MQLRIIRHAAYESRKISRTAAKKGLEHVVQTDNEEQTHSHCQDAYPQPALRSAGAFELSLSRKSQQQIDLAERLSLPLQTLPACCVADQFAVLVTPTDSGPVVLSAIRDMTLLFEGRRSWYEHHSNE